LAFHLDGARLWNASAASGIPEREYAAPFDTVWVALSKGLGAPVGSVLVGSEEQMAQARRIRKMLGGSMRQSGILAAAGLYAIEHHRPTLADDHAKARRLAEGIAALSAFDLDLDTVETNIIIFDVVDGPAQPVIDTLQADGVWVTPFGPSTIRATTHRDVSMDDIDTALKTLRRRFSTESVS
jgi:threonine aldolase